MSKEQSGYLCRELKNFINETQNIIGKSKETLEDKDLASFAEKVWSLNHFSNQLLSDKSLDESISYNARIIKDMTETPLYPDDSNNESCSLVGAADYFKKKHEFSKIKSIMSNLINDQLATEVLLDDLMVIYKELAA
ncbi:MAG: hypothetical protein S4CHLAM20_07140 [Chlamydiia bacterium]|nr:hypothetical protein [Chlamydiia bacterium]